jgi:hypothetical protein
MGNVGAGHEGLRILDFGFRFSFALRRSCFQSIKSRKPFFRYRLLFFVAPLLFIFPGSAILKKLRYRISTVIRLASIEILFL